MTTAEEMLGQLRAWLAQDRRFDVHHPYGPMDWTVLALHAYWDSWLHERDVLFAPAVKNFVSQIGESQRVRPGSV